MMSSGAFPPVCYVDSTSIIFTHNRMTLISHLFDLYTIWELSLPLACPPTALTRGKPLRYRATMVPERYHIPLDLLDPKSVNRQPGRPPYLFTHHASKRKSSTSLHSLAIDSQALSPSSSAPALMAAHFPHDLVDESNSLSKPLDATSTTDEAFLEWSKNQSSVLRSPHSQPICPFRASSE